MRRDLVAARAVLALGGNAIAPAGARGTAEEQIANIARAMGFVADLIAEGLEVVLTHGNGPQVGNLLIKNELARDVVPAMPLDWCVAQTQATIGFAIATTLGRELARRGLERPVVPVVSRVLVDAGDPAFGAPTKPIGPFVADEAEARARAERTGQTWRHVGERGWRRVVPSPEPRELLDLEAVGILLSAGAVVVAAGGGGIPMVRDADGGLRGVEAVIDKDLAAALLALRTRAAILALLTDVPAVALGYGTGHEKWLGEVAPADLRRLQHEGHFAGGSMGPKVEAVLRFVEQTGGRGGIGHLEAVGEVARGHAGTQVIPAADAARRWDTVASSGREHKDGEGAAQPSQQPGGEGGAQSRQWAVGG